MNQEVKELETSIRNLTIVHNLTGDMYNAIRRDALTDAIQKSTAFIQHSILTTSISSLNET